VSPVATNPKGSLVVIIYYDISASNTLHRCGSLEHLDNVPTLSCISHDHVTITRPVSYTIHKLACRSALCCILSHFFEPLLLPVVLSLHVCVRLRMIFVFDLIPFLNLAYLPTLSHRFISVISRHPSHHSGTAPQNFPGIVSYQTQIDCPQGPVVAYHNIPRAWQAILRS
jgi:hypothetical protein